MGCAGHLLRNGRVQLNARQNPSPTGLYPPLVCNGREPGQMGGYVDICCGRLHLQDTLTTTPFLTDEQLATANGNPTRGMQRAEYEAWQTNVHQECVALIDGIPETLATLHATNRPSRDEVELIKFLGDEAVGWRKYRTNRKGLATSPSTGTYCS